MEHYRCIDISGFQEKWESAVESFPKSGIGHIYQWGEIIQNSYGMKCYYLAAVKDKNIEGILPLVCIKSRIFKSALVSMPYLNDGGILAKNKEAMCALWKHAVQIKKNKKIKYLELRQDYPMIFEGGFERTDKIGMVLDLAGGKDHVWKKKIHRNVRNKIRKSKKLGVKIRTGKQRLPDFYKMHVENMHELGSPAHSYKFFKEATAKLNDKIKIYVAYVGNTPVGGKVVCYTNNSVHFLWVSSPFEHRKYAAVSLMDWIAIEDAIDRGCSYCDFGRSTINSTHYDFKKKWGAKEKKLYWQMYPASSIPLERNPDSLLYTFSNIWKKLPIQIVKFIGPKIRGCLPQ